MVKIITGKINSGKTTKIKEIYNKKQTGDGLISKKIMIGSNVYGFNLIRLSDNYEIPFMLHERYYYSKDIISLDNFQDDYLFEIGPYKVLKKAIYFIEETYKIIFENSTNPVFFDEVGKLEMRHLGFFKYVKIALNKNSTIYMTIREDLIPEIIKMFQIEDYEILRR